MPLAVLTFIGNKQTERKAIYIYRYKIVAGKRREELWSYFRRYDLRQFGFHVWFPFRFKLDLIIKVDLVEGRGRQSHNLLTNRLATTRLPYLTWNPKTKAKNIPVVLQNLRQIGLRVYVL